VTVNSQPVLFVESKWNDRVVSPYLKYLKRKFPRVASYQVHSESRYDFVNDEGIRLGPACKLLEEMTARIAAPRSPENKKRRTDLSRYFAGATQTLLPVMAAGWRAIIQSMLQSSGDLEVRPGVLFIRAIGAIDLK
jgi:hypothetical protein